MHTHGTISLEQAQALVTALCATGADTQRTTTWPELLKLLGRWAVEIKSEPQARIPLRPWERRQQQQQQVAVHQKAQQHAQAHLQLLQQAVSAVVAYLPDAAAALSVTKPDVAHIRTTSALTGVDLVAIGGPALAFLGAAVATMTCKAGADVDEQLQESAAAAACTAITAAAGPAMAAAVDGTSGLQDILWGYQQLLSACQDNSVHTCWLLSCLLTALRDVLPATLNQLVAAASRRCPEGAATAAWQGWAGQQTQMCIAAGVTGQLAGLYFLGRAVGLALCQAPPAAAAAGAGPHVVQQQPRSEAAGLQGCAAMSELLHAGCVAAVDIATAAVCGSVAAGLLAGCIEALSSASSAANAAVLSHTATGSMSGIWSSTAADTIRPGSQQQIQRQQQHEVVSPASLAPERQQTWQQLQLLLLDTLDAACHQCSQTAAATPGVLQLSCQLLLGHAYSNLMAVHGPAVQQHQAQWSTAGLQCSLMYMLRQCCGLSGVMHHAGCCANAAAANKWLAAEQQQRPPHEAGLLARWLADAVSSLNTKLQLLLLQVVRAEAEQVAYSYDCYLHVAKPDVLQLVDAAAVRQQLDRVFASVVAVLQAAWQQQQQQQQPTQAPLIAAHQHMRPHAVSSSRLGGASSAVVAGQGLAALAALQYCHVQLPAYVDLLRGLVGALSNSMTAADAFVSAALPCYDALISASGASGSSGSREQCEAASPVSCECHSSSSSSSSQVASTVRPWRDSPVLIARLNFLLPLIPVACTAVSDRAAATARVLPLVLLLLPHPVPQLSDGAHAAFAGLLTAAVAETSAAARASILLTTPNAADCASEEEQHQQELSAFELMQQAVPFYLERSLQGLPLTGSLEGMAVGFSCLLKQLPSGSILSLLAVKKVADRAMELTVQAACEGYQLPAQPRPAPQPQQQQVPAVSKGSADDQPANCADATAAAATRLFELVQLSLQLVDYQLLPSVLQHISALVTAAPAMVQQHWVTGLYSSCIAVDDYARKPALLAWLDGLHRKSYEAWQATANQEHRNSATQAQEVASSNAVPKSAQPPFLVA